MKRKEYRVNFMDKVFTFYAFNLNDAIILYLSYCIENALYPMIFNTFIEMGENNKDYFGKALLIIDKISEIK